MTEELGERLTQLGRETSWPQSPDETRLEWVPNPHAGILYVVRFTCPQFMSTCPVTGQPDFAHLVIDSLPKKRLVASKSLKLFLASFRNHGAFHEDCSLVVAQRLEEALEPLGFAWAGTGNPRGGRPIDVFYQSGEPPKGIWLPHRGVAPYRGRG